MDVKLTQAPQTGLIDISIVKDDFEIEKGLETMVLISLFSDAREDARTNDPRGWWGASVQNEDQLGAQFGSKLWLMLREKQTDENQVRIREWCLESLLWMIDLEIADTVDAEVSYPRESLVQIGIQISRGDREPMDFKYKFLWDGQYAL